MGKNANRPPRKKYGTDSLIQIEADGVILNVTTWPWQQFQPGQDEQEPVPGILINGVRL